MKRHFAHPGPVYWDWRCLICDEPVRGHFLRWFLADRGEGTK